jgi:hypothetical protein
VLPNRVAYSLRRPKPGPNLNPVRDSLGGPDLEPGGARSEDMTRSLLAAGLLAFAGILAATPGGAETGSAGGRTEPAPALYGVNWQGSLGLVRVDPDTLRPRGGRRVPLAGEPLGWSFSPDRSRLVLGSAARGAKLRLIDLRAMRTLGDVRVARRGSGVATAWAGPRRVLAVVVTPGCCGAGDTIVAGLDPRRRRVVWRQTLGGSLQAGERFRRGLLLVLGPPGRSVGPSRLVQVGPEGRLRSAPLPKIRSGNAPDGFVTRSWNPGLAVDRSGGRAFVVQAEAPVAEVDLRTFQVRSRPVQLEAQAADAVAGPTRNAIWLGGGLLAVTGYDNRGRGRQTPAGLTFIDTRSWRARTVDARATDAVLVSDTLLAFTFLDQRRSGSGLTGYSLDGTRKFHLFGNGPIWGVERAGRNALAGGPRGSALIHAPTGRRLRSYERFTMALISVDQPFLY